MNNMKSKESISELRRLSHSVGEFIRYWGFRKVHGAIWTQLYLHKAPLSGTELAARLDLSKALISPALSELLDWKLIHQVESADDKTKLYTAAPDVNEVIRYVLKRREEKMMEKISSSLAAVQNKSLENQGIDKKRLENLGAMVSAAEFMLSIIIQSDDLFELPKLIESKSS